MSQFPETQTPIGGPNPAADRVKGPAIGLIVTGALGILAALYGLFSNGMAMMGAGPQMQQMEAQLDQMEGAEGVDPAVFMKIMQAGGAVGIAMNIVGAIVSVVVIMGGLKMKNLESKGFATTASILAMIPCLSPCCVLGIPMGIWALVTLKDPAVQAAFKS